MEHLHGKCNCYQHILGFGLCLKGEDFCIAVQDCRRSSKWRVISRSSLECSLTFLASINSGQSLSQIGQLQTPLQKEDHSYCRPRLPVRFHSLVLGKINANMPVAIRPLQEHTASSKTGCKELLQTFLHNFSLCDTDIFRSFLKHEFRALLDEWEQ